MSLQRTNNILMIRPVAFWSNPETALTNEFQRSDLPGADEQFAQALSEFDKAVAQLTSAGVNVIVIEDTPEPPTPDAIFPNNWLTTHAGGVCVMYPMQAESRRPERRTDVLSQLQKVHGFDIQQVVDWSGYESTSRYLEGTGSMILDHINRRVFACWSPRTHADVLGQFCRRFGYEAVTFDAHGQSGKAVYHTNVMLCLGTKFAIVCDEAISDPGERRRVCDKLAEERELVRITLAQMGQFAGNMLEVENDRGEALLVMSTRARDSLTPAQHSTLSSLANFVACDVTGIENSAGGGIRCMIAELFL